MSLSNFLSRLTSVLDAAGVEYMIVGSLASTVHGLARTTQDVDIVVELDFGALVALLALLPEDDYYVSDSAARDAIRFHSQFNIIDMQTGWKADLIVRKPRPFSRDEFGRRQRTTLAGQELFVASAEDTIIAKLEWAKQSHSERQLRDVVGILDVSGPTLDMDLIRTWVEALGLSSLWEKALTLSA